MPIKIRGLEKGFEESPLQEFEGILDRYETREVNSDKWGESVRVELFFKDVVIIASTQPYNFPIAQLSLKYSDKENSVWGIFAKSLEKVLPAEGELDNCIGHKMHMTKTPGHGFGKDRETQEPIIRECWECMAVDGLAPAGPAVSAKLRALQLLDGKATLQEWHSIVFTDPGVQSEPEVIQSILDNTFLAPMVEAGVVSQDGQGAYHVKLDAVPA